MLLYLRKVNESSWPDTTWLPTIRWMRFKEPEHKSRPDQIRPESRSKALADRIFTSRCPQDWHPKRIQNQNHAWSTA
ncbi:hypothetical protein EVAR_25043_1 [Eumeta japonica]|uniref:Uncharacterized protein n=1 Tax=Eumeta variegata TaxID=151549 RepID=A0A4C1V7C3_EUMVA|nr:hypothetical protein EVAR_25043_1 [Eumeta japonica]